MTTPGSTIKKKSNAIAYHFVCEGCARDEWWTTYINTDENVADLLMKPLAGPKQTKFVRMLLHNYTWWNRRGLWWFWKCSNLYLLNCLPMIWVSFHIFSIFPSGVYEFWWFPNVTQWGLGLYYIATEWGRLINLVLVYNPSTTSQKRRPAHLRVCRSLTFFSTNLL